MILHWSPRPPIDAVRQLERLERQPWLHGPIAAMPDLHVAAGIAVGTVFATQSTVVPSALGDDLGCGMTALRLDRPIPGRAACERLLAQLAERIPTGDAVHRHRPAVALAHAFATHALQRDCERLHGRHLGTLGGGNHFVELDRDAEGQLWLLIHSGSRGLGGAIAHHHMRVADAEGSGEIRGLDASTPGGAACLRDLTWAFGFARENRAELARTACDVLQAAAVDSIDVHHNFVRVEGGLLIHRKGAISAAAGERALIPGSMGTASYLVEGRGNVRAWCSASHGAGRVLTRGQTHREIPEAKFLHSMRRVVFDVRGVRALVEEAPAAYRDIREVLEEEADLVRPLIRLEPLAVLKGWRAR